LKLIAALAGDHAHDVALLHDEDIRPIDLDLGAGPLAEQRPGHFS
jgi:hypothetical protein